MSVIDRPTDARADTASVRRRGFRPTPRRRARTAAGLAMACLAVGGNVLVYASLGDQVGVVQLTHDVRAGAQITSADVRVVEVGLDPTVPTVAAVDLGQVIGRYARVHLASGSLLAPSFVQPAPLVSSGSSVVAIEVAPSRLPAGVRERSRVGLVVLAEGNAALSAEGRVVDRDQDSGQSSGAIALSVEVRSEDATAIAAADDVRLVLLDPGIDPAVQAAGPAAP